ncbi:hypothetical protein [Marichromatium bheemlicum]|uniref:Uncharacterized protein n=1 Tax=Marichromatium bheemlicum TaxID=365339 RepID=A0ABX1I8Z6_9GAMM|nr:hypothetical protein [Marichromatium bheemlicum]NKN33509.1 hypothetical protein [Marichromatium bheemlicum]
MRASIKLWSSIVTYFYQSFGVIPAWAFASGWMLGLCSPAAYRWVPSALGMSDGERATAALGASASRRRAGERSVSTRPSSRTRRNSRGDATLRAAS